jgi:hypothetical protein
MRIYRIRTARRLIGGDMPSTRLCCSCATRRTGKSIDAVARSFLLASDHQGFTRAPASILRFHSTLPTTAKQQTP